VAKWPLYALFKSIVYLWWWVAISQQRDWRALFASKLPKIPSVTGIILAIYALARGLAAYLSGRLSDRVDSRILTTSGMLLLAFGLVKMGTLGNNSPISVLIAIVFIAGAGIGCFVAPNNRLLMRLAPAERYGAAAGFIDTSRTLGMIIGIAVAQTILSAGSSPLLARVDLAFGRAAIVPFITLALSLLINPPTDFILKEPRAHCIQGQFTKHWSRSTNAALINTPMIPRVKPIG
jgi:MFS family permease